MPGAARPRRPPGATLHLVPRPPRLDVHATTSTTPPSATSTTSTPEASTTTTVHHHPRDHRRPRPPPGARSTTSTREAHATIPSARRRRPPRPPPGTTTSTTRGTTSTVDEHDDHDDRRPRAATAQGFVSFATVDPPGDCGDIIDATGVLVTNIACAGLYTGGGGNSVPLPFAVPDLGHAVTRHHLVHRPDGHPRRHDLRRRRAATAPARDRLPLRRPAGGAEPGQHADQRLRPQRRVGGPPAARSNCNTGATTSACRSRPSSSSPATRRPIRAAPSPASSPARSAPAGTCIGGPNNGMALHGRHDGAQRRLAYPTSHDCPPDPMFNIGTLPVAFALTSGTVTWTRHDGHERHRQHRRASRTASSPASAATPNGTGAFEGTTPATAQQCWENGMAVGAACSRQPFESCEQRNNGAFGPDGGANRTIRAIGNAMSILGGPAPGHARQHLLHPADLRRDGGRGGRPARPRRRRPAGHGLALLRRDGLSVI